jgi:hypothetical protein
MMATNIQALLRALNPELHVQPEPIVPKFYVHVDLSKMEIISISPESFNDAQTKSIEIEYDLASKFISGEENIHNWAIANRDGEFSVVKPDEVEGFFHNRVELLSIVEVPFKEVPYPDVRIVVDEENDKVIIYYHGERISTWQFPLKLYFTREGDPSYLKCAFTLDTNILGTLAYLNNLNQWPNPIVIPMEDVDDLSVFTFKTDLKVSLEKNETRNF